ncbi:hypothetical protein [Azospirillum canadense]|uniref:hypothetical protein n=1 Tax=Azospirillum canadense TaxID=403962 RepID=UPI002226F237|nr:hypothetical protein [Azospirillum canadense]MCW2243583.1 hypothetical protein [Azospirillum canadense]
MPVIVRFRRNAPPYVAGELAGFPAEQAERLRQQGVVESHGHAEEAGEAEQGEGEGGVGPGASGEPTAFDPSTADTGALRAFLEQHGVKPHHKAGEDKLREMAADVLAQE